MKKWLLIIGLIFNLVGTIYLGKGLLMPDTKIDEVSATKWGSNSSLKESLIQNKQDASIGYIFIFSGFLLQLISVFIPANRKNTEQ
jgi:hypothetical protein